MPYTFTFGQSLLQQGCLICKKLNQKDLITLVTKHPLTINYDKMFVRSFEITITRFLCLFPRLSFVSFSCEIIYIWDQ